MNESSTGRPLDAHSSRRMLFVLIAAAATVMVLLVVLAARYPSREATATTPIKPLDVAALQDQAERLRGIDMAEPVDVERLDRAQMAALVTRLTADEFASERTLAVDQALHLMGVLQPPQRLRDIMGGGLGAQVAGVYDPDAKRLYVVQTPDGDASRSTVVHEIVHALQDDRYDLNRTLLRERDEDADATTAAQALIEGDATDVQTRHLAEQGPAAALDEMATALSQLAQVPAGQRQMPAYLQRATEFPYIRGVRFVQALRARGGRQAVERAFRAPPRSTLSVIQPDRYLAGDPPPVDITMPPPLPGTTRVFETTFGVADLIALGMDESTAVTWRGGRLTLDRKSARGTLTIVVVTGRPDAMLAALRPLLDPSTRLAVGRGRVTARVSGPIPQG